ncbi:MAG: UpxY family transcription antiterminator [bacterium]
MMNGNNLYGALNFTPHWYALQTMYRHEKKVDAKLIEKGVRSYLPLNTTYRRWSDRAKCVQEPLFSCYVFVHIALRDRFDALQTSGVVKLVSFNGIPAPIPGDQINVIKQILDNEHDVAIADYFTQGQKVKIVRGALKGIEGTFSNHSNKNEVIVAVDGIKQAISVKINRNYLEPVQN